MAEQMSPKIWDKFLNYLVLPIAIPAYLWPRIKHFLYTVGRNYRSDRQLLHITAELRRQTREETDIAREASRCKYLTRQILHDKQGNILYDGYDEQEALRIWRKHRDKKRN